MHRGGAEGEPTGEPSGEEDYNQSEWAGLIDSCYNLSRITGDQKLEGWALWMKREGYRLSDQEVGAKAHELMGMTEEDQREVARKFLEQKRCRERGEGGG